MALRLSTHIARWDLDKTYLRTEFDSLRDMVKTAFERPDQKRTNPGASTLLREMVRGGIRVHILSGSPEQMRRRLEDKLRLDGVTWDSFTLKPNLQNLLRFRFRAVRDQLGYKLPALLRSRAVLAVDEALACRETLFGDDAEADAYVYSLYADIVAGRVPEDVLREVLTRGRVYDDVAAEAMDAARRVEHGDVVERILIHLERQTPPDDFRGYGARIVPFYNYLQAALVLHEDDRLSADAVLRVAVELVTEHRFDGEALASSYLDLVRRGHLRGTGAPPLEAALAAWVADARLPAGTELALMRARLPAFAASASPPSEPVAYAIPDYVSLVQGHNVRARPRA